MPSANISEESALFTAHGWRLTKNMPTEATILVVDRHGRLIETVVQLRRTGGTSLLTYVGNGAAFTALVPDSYLLASDGKKWMAKDLVEHGHVSRVRFETLVRTPEFVEPKPLVNDLWQCLFDAAAFGNSESIALRCRDRAFAIRFGSVFPTRKEFGDHVFLIAHKNEIAEAVDLDWRHAITNLTRVWLSNGDDDRVEVERSAYYLALWLATAAVTSGSGYAFQFDAIQHSSYLFVTLKAKAPHPVQRGGCAFYTPYHARVVSLNWSDSSFAPIAGGFLLAAG
jgi:hypothetical protein